MISNKIAYWSDNKGMKHNYLAKQCGVSATTFSNWVTNKTQPNLKQSAMLARIFNISLDDLVEWGEETKGEKKK